MKVFPHLLTVVPSAPSIAGYGAAPPPAVEEMVPNVAVADAAVADMAVVDMAVVDMAVVDMAVVDMAVVVAVPSMRPVEIVTTGSEPNQLPGRPGGFTSAISFTGSRVPVERTPPEGSL